MVLLQVFLVKKRRGKSTKEGNFDVVVAHYSGGLTIAAGELLAEV